MDDYPAKEIKEEFRTAFAKPLWGFVVIRETKIREDGELVVLCSAGNEQTFEFLLNDLMFF